MGRPGFDEAVTTGPALVQWINDVLRTRLSRLGPTVGEVDVQLRRQIGPHFDLKAVRGHRGRSRRPRPVTRQTIIVLAEICGADPDPGLRLWEAYIQGSDDPQITVEDNPVHMHGRKPEVLDPRSLSAMTDPARPGSRIFLGYAQPDHARATEIARGLNERGLIVLLDYWHATSDRNIEQQVLEAIESSDTFVALVSDHSASYPWFNEELQAALRRRGIDIILVTLQPADLPYLPLVQGSVDFSKGSDINRLAERIRRGRAFGAASSMSGAQFEQLVAELLPRIGFNLIERQARLRDGRGDLTGIYQDPLELLELVNVIIEVKLSRDGRASAQGVAQLLKLIEADGPSTVGLLVTDGQLTSVSASLIEDANQRGIKLRVFDGPRLWRLLLENPDIAERHAIPSGLTDEAQQ